MRSKTVNKELRTVVILVKPNAKQVRIVRVAQNRYEVALNVPPKDGKANKKIIKVLAEYFSVPPSMVRITSGFASRNKRIRIIGPAT